MVEAARRLYSESVIDHWLNPRNVGRLKEPQGIGSAASGCGDTMEMSLRIRDDRIVDVGFIAQGCGTTSAVGSRTTELALGKTVLEALRIGPEEIIATLGKFPLEQRHCAELASAALKEALKDYTAFKREPWKRGYRR
jgi:nitrogen fixation NifU-like protein